MYGKVRKLLLGRWQVFPSNAFATYPKHLSDFGFQGRGCPFGIRAVGPVLHSTRDSVVDEWVLLVAGSFVA